MQTILVIGASTLIGEHICSHLLARGTKVLACSRRLLPKRRLQPNLIPITINFEVNSRHIDQDSLLQCKNVELVIHAGGWHGIGTNHAVLYQEHVIRTANILHFCRKLPNLHHYYQISSTRVTGDFAGVFDETCSAVGQRFSNPYASAIFASERLVAQSTSNFSCNIIRLGELIGSTVDGSFPRVSGLYQLLAGLQRIAAWKSSVQLLTFFPFAFTETARLPLLPVDLAATAVCTLVERNRDPHNGTWHILGGQHGVSARKILNHMLQHVGLNLEPVAVPFSLFPVQLWKTLRMPLETAAALSSPTEFRSHRFEQLVPDFNFVPFAEYASKLFEYADKNLFQDNQSKIDETFQIRGTASQRLGK